MKPEPPEEPVGQELGLGYKYVSLGISFAGGILLFMGGGYLLDRWLGILPVMTVVGTLVGSGLSFYWVYLKLQADSEARKSDEGRPGR